MKMTSFRLSEKTHIGYAHLKVADPERSLAFYRDLLGFAEARHDDTTVFLSASGDAQYRIVVTGDHNAKPRIPRLPGLFHTAIRFPNRQELARMFKRLYKNRYRFHGFSDHGVSEALYLADPDGNGIELYADRPKDQWTIKDGQLEMLTMQLDLDNLLHELSDGETSHEGIHPQTDIGHIHLQVSNLTKAERFYHEVLGFDITQRNYPGALFVSAGGYHHHIGLNIWNSRGAGPAQKDAAGLLRFGIHLPDERSLEQVKEQLTNNAYPFSENTLADRDSKSLMVQDEDGIEIEIYCG